MEHKTFEQFLEANPYPNTRSFTKEDWEISMMEKYNQEQQPQDESQKELFTGGEWKILNNPRQMNNKHGFTARIELNNDADVDVWIHRGTIEECMATTQLMTASKDMYRALKEFMKVIEGISNVPYGTKLTVTIDASVFENASKALLKATPNK